MTRPPPERPIEDDLSAQVTRSLSTIKKKDMAQNHPCLKSEDVDLIDAWAKELLAQCGPKDGLLKSYPSFFAKIPDVIKNIGTHGFKLPNPDVSTSPIFTDIKDENISFLGILHERLLGESLIYSGDAGQIRLGKFLLAKFEIDGYTTCVINELVEGCDSPISAALIRAGVPENVCDMAYDLHLKRSQQDLEAISIHPLSKQIFFEEEGRDDVLLIPVAPESMIAEIHGQAQLPGRWLALRALCAIGGANPVNGGALCSDMGGAFQLLHAEPPTFNDQTLQTRLERGGRIYTKFSVTRTDVSTFKNSIQLDETTGDKAKRDADLSAYKWFAERILEPLLQADYLVEDSVICTNGEFGGIGEYLKRNRNEPVTEELASNAVNDVFDIIVKNNSDLREHISDVTIRSMLIKKMMEVLQ